MVKLRPVNETNTPTPEPAESSPRPRAPGGPDFVLRPLNPEPESATAVGRIFDAVGEGITEAFKSQTL